MKNHYIHATIEMLQSGADPEKMLEGLRNTMHKKGHMRLYAPVLRGVLRVLETKKDPSVATVVVAYDTDVQKYADIIKNTLSLLNAGSDFSTKVDETIIGGSIVKNHNTIVDRSYKTMLANLYRSVTK